MLLSTIKAKIKKKQTKRKKQTGQTNDRTGSKAFNQINRTDLKGRLMRIRMNIHMNAHTEIEKISLRSFILD